MNQDYQERAKFIQEEQRKNLIQAALLRLKRKNQSFLYDLEANAKWRKIYNGLLFNNCQSQLPKLINLQLCEANDNEDLGFFNPFEKIPIRLCYNKINKKQQFQTHALFNLILLYDSRVKKEMNWNNIEQTAKSTIRALNISGLCKRTDKTCFQAEIQKRVLQKERFKGKSLDFDKVFENALADMAPISQIGSS